MSEIKNNEKNIDSPPVKEEIKKPEDHKKQEDMGNNLDRMRSTGGTSLESKTAQSRITETPNQKEIKEGKSKSTETQDKRTAIGTKLDNLSSTGNKKTDQQKLSDVEQTEKETKYKADSKEYYGKLSNEAKSTYESSKAENLIANHKRNYKLDNEDNAVAVNEKLKENPNWKPDPVSFKDLNSEERQNLSNRCADILEDTPEDKRQDFRVPSPEKIKGVTSDGRIIENWKPRTDGAEEGTRRMEIPQKGQIIDRIGSESGNYFSPMNKSGEPYSLKERATGDRINGKDITESNAYRQYEVLKDFNKDNFLDAITTSNLTNAEKINMRGQLESYYNDCKSTTSENHKGEAYTKEDQNADGVKTAKIAPMFQKDDGGAVQYETPFTAEELKKIGMIKEYKPENSSKTENSNTKDKSEINSA